MPSHVEAVLSARGGPAPYRDTSCCFLAFNAYNTLQGVVFLKGRRWSGWWAVWRMSIRENIVAWDTEAIYHCTSTCCKSHFMLLLHCHSTLQWIPLSKEFQLCSSRLDFYMGCVGGQCMKSSLWSQVGIGVVSNSQVEVLWLTVSLQAAVGLPMTYFGGQGLPLLKALPALSTLFKTGHDHLGKVLLEPLEVLPEIVGRCMQNQNDVNMVVICRL